jgi:hypothetical protein
MQADLQTETTTVAALRDLFSAVLCTEIANLQKFAGLTIFGGCARVVLTAADIVYGLMGPQLKGITLKHSSEL